MGQLHEIGFSFGGSNYIGDIGSTNYVYPNKPAGALFYKYNWNPRVALRGTYSLLSISGDDKDASTDYRKDRGLRFSNIINEVAIGLEYNFYEYDISSSEKKWTPYLLLELVGFKYSGVESYSSTGNVSYEKKTSIAVPFGIGYKSKLEGNIAFSIEAKFRYTFVDDLDFVSNKMPNMILEGSGNDWYMFTGFSLIYTFGRPPCFTNGF